MNNAVAGLISVMAAIIGLATLSIILSPRAQTVGVVNATANAFNGALQAAEAPVTGASLTLNPSAGFAHTLN